MRIVWDEPKRLGNLSRRGLDFADLSLDFFETALVLPAKFGRQMALGEFRDGMIIAVVLRRLGREAISVISMRPASRRERRRLDEK